MAAMFGWFSEASTSASRWNRASRSVSAANRLRQDLDGDRPLQVRVGRPIDLAHPARAKRADISYGPRRAPAAKVTGVYAADYTRAGGQELRPSASDEVARTATYSIEGRALIGHPRWHWSRISQHSEATMLRLGRGQRQILIARRFRRTGELYRGVALLRSVPLRRVPFRGRWLPVSVAAMGAASWGSGCDWRHMED